MTPRKNCLWKVVYSMHPDELLDAMFLSPSSDCHHCDGNDTLCPDYVEIWENSTTEVMKLKHQAHYHPIDLIQRRNGSLERR